MGYSKELRRPIIGLVFVVGLLLGWMVIGWWLWPVEWTNTDPWDLRLEHQWKFVGLVAEEYWQTKDVPQAREALAGWDTEALTDLLAAMQIQACDSQARQQLAALAAALRLPASQTPPSTGKAFSPSSTSPRKVPGQPVIWGVVLSAPVPVVAAAIIVSLRVLKAGTEKARKKRRRTRPEELEQEWLTEEQLAQEGQIEAQQPRAQQPQPQQVAAAQAAQMEQQVAAQTAQMQQQVAAQTAQMQQQMEQQKELQAMQMQKQMQQQMQQQVEQQKELQAMQMQQQMQQQVDLQVEQMQQMAQAKPETPKQARDQTLGMLAPMKDWLGDVQEQLQGMQEQSPELQQLLSPMLDQVDFLMGNLGQMKEDMPRLSQQQLQGKMGQMQMQMLKMLEQFKQLEGNLPANISPQARAALAQMQQFAMQAMAQFQQQVGQIQQLKGQFDAGPATHQQSDLEAALGDILADAFEEEEAMDPNLDALIKSLPYVDILDVLEKGKEIAKQLKRGISLAPGLIYEIRGVEP